MWSSEVGFIIWWAYNLSYLQCHCPIVIRIKVFLYRSLLPVHLWIYMVHSITGHEIFKIWTILNNSNLLIDLLESCSIVYALCNHPGNLLIFPSINVCNWLASVRNKGPIWKNRKKIFMMFCFNIQYGRNHIWVVQGEINWPKFNLTQFKLFLLLDSENFILSFYVCPCYYHHYRPYDSITT